jgi:leucyl aminopeptidase
MQVTSFTGRLLKARADLLVLGLFGEPKSEPAIVKELDRALGGALKSAMADEGFKGKAKHRLLLHSLEKLAVKRVGLIGLGKAGEATLETWLAFAANSTRLANKVGARSVVVVLPSRPDDLAELFGVLSRGAHLGGYRFDRFKSDKGRPRTVATLAFAFADGRAAPTLAAGAIKRGAIVAEAVSFARDLANEPAADLYPEAMVKYAKEVAKRAHLGVRVFTERELKTHGMGLILAVGQGSPRPPRFVHLTYAPKKPIATVALVGKGITFDSGGLCLKQPTSMLEMKMDMSGAAVVLATMEALSRLKAPVAVHGLLALAENMPSGTALKLGDVVKSASKKTVEIGNTDAEGRLILADALHYAKNLKPDLMIDVATLTAAVIVALGPHTTGVFTPDERAAATVLAASARAAESAWRLPLIAALKDNLKSEVADLKNTAERNGGAISAALFLKEFVGDVPWVHLDIAGPAMSAKDEGAVTKGGTGVGVATLVELLAGGSPLRNEL